MARRELPPTLNDYHRPSSQQEAEESMIMEPSGGFAGAVWRKSTRRDSNGGQCGEVTSLEGRRCRVAGFSQPHGRRARLDEFGWRGADRQPGRVEGLPIVGSGPGVSLVRRVGVRPTRRVVCDAITQ